ncbi:hypothetical protein SAMN05444410_103138 [Hydrobacter penzbergensis]|uniref:Helix-turn-helix domain-containing protein n=1 Tax=Hydrobacter penzbergensis TaxID=1235997 RepID=A0A8X8IER7_9BACT|nr:hypothetical protein [Hydrobacter penzbergensis]SDW50292.1 hypothetical protein SAMN05444410_103138 [Hydrobacter penzbergensis]
MDRLCYLSDFFEAIGTDARISITHIGIYAALLQYRVQNDFANPIQAFSHEILTIAKLSSAITYHKCVRELSEYGYIRYEPSFNKNKGSKIYFVERSD